MKRKFISTKGPLYWKYIKTQLIPARCSVDVRATDNTLLGVVDVSENGCIKHNGMAFKTVSALVSHIVGRKVLAGCWDFLFYNGTPLKELALPVFRQVPTEEPVGYSVWFSVVKEWMKLRVSWGYNGMYCCCCVLLCVVLTENDTPGCCKEKFQVPNSYVWYLLRNVKVDPHSDRKKRTFPTGMFIVEKYYFFDAIAIAELFGLKERRYVQLLFVIVDSAQRMD